MSQSHHYRLGFWLAIGAAFGFSFKAVFVKLSYQVPNIEPIDAVTLLMLRMLFAAPAFGLAAYRGRSAASLTNRQWGLLVVVGLSGYYGASTYVVAGGDMKGSVVHPWTSEGACLEVL